MAFRLPVVQLEKDGLWATPPCLRVLGWKDYLPAKEFRGFWDYQILRKKETVVLVMALQRCAVHSGRPPCMLCRAVQELCSCLVPLVEKGNLLDLEMLDVSMKDPVMPAPELQEVDSTTPSSPTITEISEPAGTTHTEERALVLRHLLSTPPRFTRPWVEESGRPLGRSGTTTHDSFGDPTGPQLLGLPTCVNLP